jgi:hypothetical protein
VEVTSPPTARHEVKVTQDDLGEEDAGDVVLLDDY